MPKLFRVKGFGVKALANRVPDGTLPACEHLLSERITTLG